MLRNIQPFLSSFHRIVYLNRVVRQRRELAAYVKNKAPNIGEIYTKLLNQSATTAIPCNFVEQVVDQWAQDPKKQALRSIDQDSGESISISYQDIQRRSQDIGDYFVKNGFKKGDSVALMLGQRPAWWYSLAGLIREGIAVVPCSRLLTSNDLIYRINDLKIRGIITAPELQHRVDSIRDKCPSLVKSVTSGTASISWDSLTDIFNSNGILSTARANTTTADPCVYLYTSGTTGQPKAVIHNHDYPFFHWPTGRRWLRATPQDLIYNASDTGWGFTLWVTTAAWATGAELLITPTTQKFNPQKMLAILQDQPVTIFCAAPTVLRILVAQRNFSDFKFRHLKRIVTIGEALDETVIKQFESMGIEVAVGFGQAETPLLMGRVDNQPHVPGTMGQPVTPYHIVVLDDNLRPSPPGNSGQIAVDLVKSGKGGIMRGYANAPEKTQEAFSPYGRFYLTGDWAKLLPNGFFSYEGRRDDLLKVNGYRIGPDEVEKAGMSHPSVAKIAVVTVPKEPGSLAQVIKAFILLKSGYTETPGLISEIQEHIKRETAPYKYPRRVEFLSLEEWQKYETTSGKIRRAGLREREATPAKPIKKEITELKQQAPDATILFYKLNF